MDGLDLTPWIEHESSLGMPFWVLLGIMVVGGVMVFFLEDFFDRRGLKKIGWGVFCVGFAITMPDNRKEKTR